MNQTIWRDGVNVMSEVSSVFFTRTGLVWSGNCLVQSQHLFLNPKSWATFALDTLLFPHLLTQWIHKAKHAWLAFIDLYINKSITLRCAGVWGQAILRQCWTLDSDWSEDGDEKLSSPARFVLMYFILRCPHYFHSNSLHTGTCVVGAQHEQIYKMIVYL